MDFTNFTQSGTWAIAQSAFANPMYLQAPLGATGNTDSTGFQIINSSVVVVAFTGTYTGEAVAHEQTLDPTGAAGWFSVLGSPAAGGSSSSSGATSGQTYVFPSLGARHRIKITALGSGTIEARVALEGSAASGPGSGGGGGGGSLGGTATASSPTYAEGATGQALSLNLSGHLRVLDSTAVTLLTSIDTAVNTPATYLPPEPVVAASDTTLTRSVVSISSATDTTLVTGTASQTTRLHRMVLTVAGANTLTFKSASTSLGAFAIPSAGMWTLDFCSYPWFKTATAEALVLTTSTAQAVTGWFDYVKGA